MGKKVAGAPKKDNFTRNLVVVVVVGVILIMLVPTLISKQGDKTAAIPASVSSSEGYGIVFNADLVGKPKIEIYEDFQCPFCATFEQMAGEYLEDLIAKKEAKVVYHPLSFIGEESVRAANAAACAADENNFLDFHKNLYANQPSAENSGEWSNDYLKATGLGVGITGSNFASCVDTLKYQDWVVNVANEGGKRNVNSTPTVFINGNKLDNATSITSLEAFKAAVAKG
jgi:protein-disulfide isomerase